MIKTTIHFQKTKIRIVVLQTGDTQAGSSPQIDCGQ